MHFVDAKGILTTLLEHGAVSQAQHDKSLGDLTEKMGMHSSDRRHKFPLCYNEVGIDLLKVPLRDIGGYPFMTLEDETEIVHSEPLTVDGKEKVKVVIEQPVTGGFHSTVCWLPDYTWKKIQDSAKKKSINTRN